MSIVTVNHNTRTLLALLVWSLYRVLADSTPLDEIVVVDNGSTDGSGELLAALADARLCTVLANEKNRYHGPALNQAFSYLAARARSSGSAPGWVWILDSDCVVARPDALSAALAAATMQRAALVGEQQWDRWHERYRFGIHCLLVRPARVWRDAISPFTDDGDPLYQLLCACEREMLRSMAFPFLTAGYVIHRGRSTLAEVTARDDRSNRFYDWATDHHDAHFGEVPGAEARHRALMRAFEASVPNLSGSDLVDACRKPSAAG